MFTAPHPVGRPGPYQNFIWLRTLAQVPTIVRNPLEAFARFQFEVPVSRYVMFGTRFVMVNDPELIRHIFVERSDALDAQPLRQKVLRPALRDGMLTAEGDVWRKARRAIAPVFSPRHVDNFGSPMRTATDRFIKSLPDHADQILMAPLLTKLAYMILSETLFSGEIDGDEEAILSDVAYFLKHLSNIDPLDLMGAPDWLPRPSRIRGGNATKRLRESVRRAAQKRQTRISNGDPVPSDFLTLLLRSGDSDTNRLTLDEIEDNIITFIAAGHETTARALSWTLYLLAHDQDALMRAEAEADALDIDNTAPQMWAGHLPWITACLEESMRLFPPAAVILRRLNANIEWPGQNIDKGTDVYVSPWVLHRHDLLWVNPAAFNPGRFFGDNRKQIGRFAYLPFGVGPRVCIGASFALQEAQIALTLLLRQYRFEYTVPTKPWPVMKITIQPDNQLPMTLRRRR